MIKYNVSWLQHSLNEHGITYYKKVMRIILEPIKRRKNRKNKILISFLWIIGRRVIPVCVICLSSKYCSLLRIRKNTTINPIKYKKTYSKEIIFISIKSTYMINIIIIKLYKKLANKIFENKILKNFVFSYTESKSLPF